MAAEAAACARELTATVKARMLAHKEEAAECISMLRKLGEPVEALQVDTLPVGMAWHGRTLPREPMDRLHSIICQPAALFTALRIPAHPVGTILGFTSGTAPACAGKGAVYGECM